MKEAELEQKVLEAVERFNSLPFAVLVQVVLTETGTYTAAAERELKAAVLSERPIGVLAG